MRKVGIRASHPVEPKCDDDGYIAMVAIVCFAGFSDRQFSGKPLGSQKPLHKETTKCDQITA
jgi:hypothetical protein